MSATAALAGKVALVTGGAGGFGLASALLLARDGAAVTLTGRNIDSLTAARACIDPSQLSRRRFTTMRVASATPSHASKDSSR